MSNYNQSLIESLIEDYRQTIERLQKECTEKTNAIIALGERLKAKEQECEELKKELNGSEKWRIKAESLNEKLELNNGRYHEALEEIKKVLSHCVVTGAIVKILYIISKTQECEELKECMNVKSDRYRKALEEIEKYCIHYLKHNPKSPSIDLNVILNIINKAKGRSE